MRIPAALPDPLNEGSFTSSRAKELGVSKARLRAPSLYTPVRGVRMAAPPTTVWEQARAVAEVLTPPFAFSHATAARMLGLPLPTRWSSVESIHVMRPSRVNSPDLAGVSAHRGLERRDTTGRKALRVVDLADTWCDLGDHLDLLDLVIAGDAALNRDEITLEVLKSAIAKRGRRRGVVGLKAAWQLCLPGSASATETRARVAFVSGRLPMPELNAQIATPDGEWLACVDMLWRAQRLIAEVDGDHHRSRRQWQKDIRLRRRITDAGWRIEVITGDDVIDAERSAEMVERFRGILRAR